MAPKDRIRGDGSTKSTLNIHQVRVQEDDQQHNNPTADISDGEGTVAPRKPLAFYLSFIGICFSALVCALDATSLGVAIPSIAEQLGGTTLQSFWASIAYLLCVVTTQPLYTAVSDVFGRKPPLYLAYAFFAAGSLVFALAGNMPAVIAGRVLQGLGGGGMDVLGEIVVADMTTLRERPVYLGVKALPMAVGSILGPTMGALFSSFASWRWIGWVNLPLLGVAAPLVFFFLRLRPADTAPLGDKLARLDWGGAALALAGTTALVLPLSWAGTLYPWRSWQTLLPLVSGLALLAAFGAYEARPAHPIVPHRVLRSRTAAATLVGNFAHGAMLFALLQYLPLFFQAVALETPIRSAVLLLPTSAASVAAAVAGVIAVGLVGRGYKWALRATWAVTAAGAGLLALLGPESSRPAQMGVPVVWGIGIGALMRLLHLPMQASVPSVDDTGAAIGVSLAVRLLGGLIGLAIGSTVFSSVFASSIAAVSELPGSLSILRDANQAIGFIPTLRTLDIPHGELTPVLDAYLEAMRAIFYTMTGFGAAGFASSLFTEELTLNKTERGRQAFED
ncbi:uncharacterized protein E0L32_004134 [Thyridium curvatum]|uniref:Major facilitator superfamily (MFS) profile domain-containing protein n=1 Tax=Thyridium curvatum TaxID=1093900 RepID=A0A507BFR2_9PEZI|nr:uncharacterized protein E0L32_004134 [Thyridium curvatum]TPX16139.1 hypothetical protein E0L32_004134 [Thyridium curvatum]